MSLLGSRYGPDASGLWVRDSAGFAFRGTQVASSQPVEAQPFWDPETGLVVLLDGRLDDQVTLAAGCRAAGYPPQTSGMPELILRAYQAWGTACPRQILGEYAFVLWDSRRGRL